MKITDLVKNFRRVSVSELRPNPRNWRTHPKAQLDALRGALAEIGFAGAGLARELPDGSLELIDGHARCETLPPDFLMPVLVIDADDAKVAKILATLDPLGAMAEADRDKLDALLREVEVASEPLADMLEDLAKKAGVIPPESSEVTPPDEFGSYGEGIDTEYKCPKCGYEWSGRPK
jgi:hypothetical protein